MRTRLLLLLVLLPLITLSQDFDIVMEGPPENSDFKELRTKLRRDDIDQIAEAFKTLDFDKLSKYLHPKLDKKEVKKLIEAVKALAKDNEWILITHYNGNVISTGYPGVTGDVNTAVLQLTREDAKMELQYRYLIQDSSMYINSIIADGSYPLDFKFYIPVDFRLYETLMYKIYNAPDSTYENMRQLEAEFIPVFKRMGAYNYPFIDEVKLQQSLAQCYGNLSWRLLEKKDFQGALNAAVTGLARDPNQKWINTNLALAQVLLGNFKSAEKTYNNLKDQEIRKGESYRSVFLKDISDLEKIGITHPDFEKVKKLLVP
jgi:hypothetical protein